jgi:hypothetical protein
LKAGELSDISRESDIKEAISVSDNVDLSVMERGSNEGPGYKPEEFIDDTSSINATWVLECDGASVYEYFDPFNYLVAAGLGHGDRVTVCSCITGTSYRNSAIQNKLFDLAGLVDGFDKQKLMLWWSMKFFVKNGLYFELQ